MTSLRLLVRRLRFLFHRRSEEQEMAEELRLHLEMRAEEAIGEGVLPEEARLAAERRFGNKGLIEERCRDQLVFSELEHLRQDVRYAVRTLCRNLPKPTAFHSRIFDNALPNRAPRGGGPPEACRCVPCPRV